MGETVAPQHRADLQLTVTCWAEPEVRPALENQHWSKTSGPGVANVSERFRSALSRQLPDGHLLGRAFKRRQNRLLKAHGLAVCYRGGDGRILRRGRQSSDLEPGRRIDEAHSGRTRQLRGKWVQKGPALVQLERPRYRG